MTATAQPVQLAVHGADWTYVNELRRRRAGVRRASGRQPVPSGTAAANPQEPDTARRPATWQHWYPIIAGAMPEGTDPAVIRHIAVTVSMQKYRDLVDELAQTLEA